MRDDGERASPLDFFGYVHRAADSSKKSRGNKPGNWEVARERGWVADQPQQFSHCCG
jgi:hypothetical protein